MSADDISVGYPVHALAEYSVWTNPHGASFTDWKAACGATGRTSSSPQFAFGKAGSARRRELCKTCWPAGWATPHSNPRRVDAS